MRIFGFEPVPTFAEVEASIAAGGVETTSFGDLMPAFARGLYDGATVGAGLILVALAALVIWNQVAAVALAEDAPPTKSEVATRNRP
jgi:hypothetical protein